MKTTFTSALVNSNSLDCSFYFFTGDHFSFSPIFSCRKLQKADFVALFPFAICFFSNVTDFCRYYVCTFKQSTRFRCARTSVWTKAFRLWVFLMLNYQMRKLRGKNNVIRNIPISFPAVQHFVFLPVIHVHAFERNPSFLF